ncbi:FYVE, RhoGEF and PH domain-containing protein 4-like isoform X2 [Archocentrus centrarchus]|uniref:FYVE, RhoGEF and PH domain-containing protein 4-like isoform X2 n=1 Tax=Archocentrus centrarchus TaxID=63155 RepID=UPI0011E9C04A|nr:FYVE, RhoGEF and PH domain-containing protein 4-like isoform X2 [Archocentrus centrarchus]
MMFDLKKRNSLTLRDSRGTDEFRRVAVRRKVHGPVGDCQTADVSSSVCGSYSRSRARDRISGSELIVKPGAETNDEKSPTKPSSFKPQAPRRSAHLQSPSRLGQDQAYNPTPGKVLPQQINGTEEKQSPNRSNGISISCVSPQNCQDSLAEGGGSCLNAQGIPNLTCRSISGSPSPGKRGIQSCSSLRGGGHSPGQLSPRNHRALTGKLRAPSPAQGKMRSYSPAKSSKSLLGLHRISSEKMERREKRAGKSLSVPDLIVYLDESRIPSEKAERSPLKLLHSPNSNTPAITLKASPNRRRSLTANEDHRSSSGPERSPRQMNCIVQEKEWPAANGTRLNDKLEESNEPTRYGSKFSCQWTVATTEDEKVHDESRGEQNEEEKQKQEERGGDEPKNKESTEQKLFNIANELLQTEEAYVARLHLLDQVFCSRLTEEAGRGSFPPEVIRNIFSNISSIYSFHSQFLLPDLENCIRHWCESPGLGKVLLQHVPFLKMYANYVRNFDHAMELVRTWTERSSAFRSIIQDIQSQGICGMLTLQHHMLEPVQRVPRYEMLLKDYLKKLPEDDPDYELAQKSLQTISMAATHSNSAIQEAESLKRLLEIYEMIGEEEVINPTNEFLREGRLLKLAARNTSAMERHLFLFNNFLLCCSPKFSLVGQRFTVRCRIGMDGMQVQETTNEDYPHTFQISGRERALELQASSKQDRDEWIKVIREAIDVFQKKNEAFRAASKELTVSEPTEELGRRAPRWIRDNEVTLCMSCMEPFNAFTRRRHHCRACGFVVCWKCSDNKVALEYDDYKLNKVCKCCYAALTGQRGEGLDGKKRQMLESEASSDTMSGFLQYGDNPQTWQRVWSVLTKTEPPVFYLYSVPQDLEPLFTIPLLGCTIEAFPEAHQGQSCFCVTQSKTSHIFTCDSLDLKWSWLSALKFAVTGWSTACSLAAPDDSSGIRSGINGSLGSDDSVVSGNKENHS